MEKTISSSCYDVVVVKHDEYSYKSTPFQVVFSTSTLKNRSKIIYNHNNQLKLHINGSYIDIPIRLDSNGRVNFQIKINRKSSVSSDLSDLSDDDRSQKSSSREKIINKNITKAQKVDDYKNQKNFWQFAWLFKKKDKDQNTKNDEQWQESQRRDSELQKIKQQIYQGQQSSKQPFFHLSLCGQQLKKKQTRKEILQTFYKNRIQYHSFIKDPPAYLNDNNLVVKIDDSIYTWQLGISILVCNFAYGKVMSDTLIDDVSKNKFTKSKWFTLFSGSNLAKWNINDIRFDKKIEMQPTKNNLNQMTKDVDYKKKYRKSPDTDGIKLMNLNEGLNKAIFSLDLGRGITEQVEFRIFLWKSDEKLIISDIDGTITKSDILGQVLNNWIHPGITKLFTQIYQRNYKIIYMTARAIGQYKQTLKFLQTVQQDSVKLPQGPLMMSPDGYLTSFRRQVIDKNPDKLKAKILARINEVFPSSKNPIFCGFGNRQTDSIAYLRINIPAQRIYDISESSVVTNKFDQKLTTYVEMLKEIDDYFPENIRSQNQKKTVQNHQGLQQQIDKKSKSLLSQSCLYKINKSQLEEQMQEFSPTLRVKSEQNCSLQLQNSPQKIIQQFQIFEEKINKIQTKIQKVLSESQNVKNIEEKAHQSRDEKKIEDIEEQMKKQIKQAIIEQKINKIEQIKQKQPDKLDDLEKNISEEI